MFNVNAKFYDNIKCDVMDNVTENLWYGWHTRCNEIYNLIVG